VECSYVLAWYAKYLWDAGEDDEQEDAGEDSFDSVY
jgi:hypothetical protein